MEYCIWLDVSKGKSMFLLTNVEGVVLFGPRVSVHSHSSCKEIHQPILASYLGAKPTVIQESASIYHLPVDHFLKIKDTSLFCSIQSFRGSIKKSQTAKTDALDCLNLTHIFFKKTYNLQHSTQAVYVEIQSLSQQINHLQGVLTQMKNRLRNVLI